MNNDVDLIIQLLHQCLLNQRSIMDFLDKDYFKKNIEVTTEISNLIVLGLKKVNEMSD